MYFLSRRMKRTMENVPLHYPYKAFSFRHWTLHLFLKLEISSADQGDFHWIKHLFRLSDINIHQFNFTKRTTNNEYVAMDRTVWREALLWMQCITLLQTRKWLKFNKHLLYTQNRMHMLLLWHKTSTRIYHRYFDTNLMTLTPKVFSMLHVLFWVIICLSLWSHA